MGLNMERAEGMVVVVEWEGEFCWEWMATSLSASSRRFTAGLGGESVLMAE